MKPTATGPMTLENDGATPSQLKMRTRSVLSRAARPAVRWITSMPVLAPLPVAIAAALDVKTVLPVQCTEHYNPAH